MIHKYLAIAPAMAALLLAAACSNDDSVEGTGENVGSADELVVLRLTSSIEAQSRTTHNLDTQIATGETVHVWVDDAGLTEEAELYEDNAMTVADGGSLTGGKTMYFPSTGNGVDIYAVHGNFGDADLSASFWNTAVTHSVEQDQQSTVTEAGAGYSGSDLVYCEKDAVGRATSAVSLTFTHLLSKVEVVLKQGDGNPGLEKVEIINTQLQAEFTPEKGSGIAVTAAGDMGENAIVIDSDFTDADGETVLNEAIIVPQTVAGGTQFIRVTTDKSGVLAYTLPSDGDVTFEAGKKYRYTITVSQTGLEVTTEISEWNETETLEISVKREVNYKTDLSEASVGDLITADGELISAADLDILTADDIAKVVGVVYWVPEAADGSRTYQASLTYDKIMASEHPDCTHGLAVGLVNISSGGEDMKWQQYGQSVGSWQRFQDYYNPNTTDYVTISTNTDDGGDPEIINYILGYQNTNVLRYYNANGAYEDVYEILPVLGLDEYLISAPAGSTGWFLPSIKELHMLCYKDVDDISNANGSECTETRDIVNASLEAAGGSQLASVRYWSSTEDGYSLCYIVDFTDASVIEDGKNGYSSIYNDAGEETGNTQFSCYARPVCAF